ncbi:MAG: amino acid decarboxylase [Clostridia bacterium]|nr:amino acid decarboxylase [Clostridia bacterium]
MMNTPIIDFLEKYALSGTMRLHMPGHKGRCFLGPEKFDITEIKGADSLYDADGIIQMSEKNASSLFGSHTFYSAEGSSLAIRAMLYLASLYAKEKGKKAKILSGRNAHKTFISGAALLDIDVEWIFPKLSESYLSCTVFPEELDRMLSDDEFCAVYVTSPDYLGNLCNIEEISGVCKKHGVLLLLDNAHGAYLKFLPESLHPTDLGADMCCDSAHKTLPVLTGGAYLHISHSAPSYLLEKAKYAMSVFGSTSPSYLIMASLDHANEYIYDGYRKTLSDFCEKIGVLKNELCEKGFSLLGDEILKLSIDTKKYGYEGTEFADILRNSGIECEFSDNDFVVFMLSPEMTDLDIERLKNSLLSITKKDEIKDIPPAISKPEKIMTPRDATLSISERVEIENSEGRILASLCVSCPPAVSYIVCGEKIDRSVIELAKYYNTKYFDVVI